MSNPHQITPCPVCGSIERKEGEYWQHYCAKHRVIQSICNSGVHDGLMSAKNASLEDLHEAFSFALGRCGKTLRVGIAREINRRMKAKK